MLPRLDVGCPMWANRAWVGPYYQAGTRPGDELAQYVQWCTAVEGNTTFYALPTADTVRNWSEVTPQTFRFMFKLPKTITHDRRLRGVDADLTSFLRLLEPLGERRGPFSIQLPPSFGPGDIGVLTAFLRRAPTEVSWSVEVRHPQFFDGGRAHQTLDRLLLDLGVERINLDTRTLFSKPPTDACERDAWSKKPRLPVVPTALTSTPVVRFVGRDTDEDTVAGWQEWIPTLVRWLAEGRRPTVFVHTPDNERALLLARQLHAEVGALSAVVGDLPNPPEAPVEQRSLFDSLD